MNNIVTTEHRFLIVLAPLQYTLNQSYCVADVICAVNCISNSNQKQPCLVMSIWTMVSGSVCIGAVIVHSIQYQFYCVVSVTVMVNIISRQWYCGTQSFPFGQQLFVPHKEHVICWYFNTIYLLIIVYSILLVILNQLRVENILS